MACLDIVSLYPSLGTHEVCNKVCDYIEKIEESEGDMKLINIRKTTYK